MRLSLKNPSYTLEDDLVLTFCVDVGNNLTFDIPVTVNVTVVSVTATGMKISHFNAAVNMNYFHIVYYSFCVVNLK